MQSVSCCWSNPVAIVEVEIVLATKVRREDGGADTLFCWGGPDFGFTLSASFVDVDARKRVLDVNTLDFMLSNISLWRRLVL